MKLLYLTTVQIPADNAQSLQIQAMSKAFHSVLKDDFLLISPKNKRNAILSTEYNWIKIKIPKFLGRSWRYFLLIIKALPKVLEFKPDFIYSRDIGVVFFYKLLGFKAAYEIHRPFETKIGNLLFKLIAPKIKIVAISNALKQYIIEKYFRPRESASSQRPSASFSENILVAHDGVFLEDFEKITDSKESLKKNYLNLDENQFVALYSGSFQEGKGLELILEAAKQLKDITFVIIGSPSSPRPSAFNSQRSSASSQRPSASNPRLSASSPRQSAPNQRESALSSNVLFLGRKSPEEIPFYLKSADLLVLPFTKELKTYQYHSALKMFEYMASGVPILASNLGSILEILNENNAFLFDPDDQDNFIEKIKKIKENYSAAEKKAIQALQNVRNYTWQKRVENILRFLGD